MQFKPIRKPVLVLTDRDKNLPARGKYELAPHPIPQSYLDSIGVRGMPVQSDDTPKVIRDIASQLPSEFALIEYLGEGGHGLVLKALHKTMHHNVALKIIKTDNSEETSRRVQRMQNEAKVLARLNHKNIVKVFQMSACKDGTPFLICEFVEGITLAQLLSKNKQLSPKMIIQIFTQILDALSCAHENGLLHRDIKPSNIMIVKDKETGATEVKLLDFGIARDFEQLQSDTIGLTRTIQISGSAPYMSPEQCRGGRLDQRSDLYSVACVLYECLAGYPPFTGETPMHTRYQHIHDEAARPKDDRYATTVGRRAIFDLVMDGLSKDPNIRPASADAFKLRLFEALPFAEKRETWTARRALFSKRLLLASSILAVASSIALVAIVKQNRDNTKLKAIDSESHSTSHALMGSKESQLNQLRKAFNDFDLSKSFASSYEGVTLIKRLDDYNKSLRPGKSDQFLHYCALRMKGLLEYKFAFNKEANQTWLEAVKYCVLPDGKPSAEAIESNLYIARTEFNLLDFPKAKKYALVGLKVAKENSSASGTALFMDIPNLYASRAPVQTSECYTVLADVSQHMGDYKSELKYRQLAENERLKKELVNTTSTLLLNIADAAQRAKGNEAARKIVRDRQSELVARIDKVDNWDNLAIAMEELGDWFGKNGFWADARDCYNAVSRLAAMHPDASNAAWISKRMQQKIRAQSGRLNN